MNIDFIKIDDDIESTTEWTNKQIPGVYEMIIRSMNKPGRITIKEWAERVLRESKPAIITKRYGFKNDK